jgi:hypothetical protein
MILDGGSIAGRKSTRRVFGQLLIRQVVIVFVRQQLAHQIIRRGGEGVAMWWRARVVS